MLVQPEQGPGAVVGKSFGGRLLGGQVKRFDRYRFLLLRWAQAEGLGHFLLARTPGGRLQLPAATAAL